MRVFTILCLMIIFNNLSIAQQWSDWSLNFPDESLGDNYPIYEYWDAPYQSEKKTEEDFYLFAPTSYKDEHYVFAITQVWSVDDGSSASNEFTVSPLTWEAITLWEESLEEPLGNRDINGESIGGEVYTSVTGEEHPLYGVRSLSKAEINSAISLHVLRQLDTGETYSSGDGFSGVSGTKIEFDNNGDLFNWTGGQVQAGLPPSLSLSLQFDIVDPPFGYQNKSMFMQWASPTGEGTSGYGNKFTIVWKWKGIHSKVKAEGYDDYTSSPSNAFSYAEAYFTPEEPFE